MSDERRLFERFGTRFPTKFKDSYNEYGTDVFLRDASATGVRINTRERMFLDDPITLEVALPDGGAPMLISGKVVWTKTAGASAWDVGVQFPCVDLMKMNRLLKFAPQN